MGTENQQTQIQMQPEKIQIETTKQMNPQTLREHLNQLHQWDVSDKTIEEQRREKSRQLMSQQLQLNQALLSQIQQNVPPADASGTAPGEAIQEQKPARETYKQKKERKRKEKEAQKHNPAADHITYDAVNALMERKKSHNNSFSKKYKAQATDQKVDQRVLDAFVYGHQTNKKGNPASDADAWYKAEDEKFLEDYISKDVQRRKPHLDRIVAQVLSYSLSPEMFTDEYLGENAALLRGIGNQLTYFENVMKDPINAPYFEQLDQYTKDLLEARVFKIYAQFGAHLTDVMAAKGISCNNDGYFKENVSIYQELKEGSNLVFRDALIESKQLEKEAAQREMERLMAANRESLMQDADQMKEAAQGMEGLEDLNLTSFVMDYSFDELSKYRSMIESNPGAYQAYPEAIDKLYQELHHSMDALGDVTLEIMAAQNICAEYQDMKNFREKALVSSASAYQEVVTKQADLVRGQISGVADALQFLLRGKDMTKPAENVLKTLGLEGVIQEGQLRQAFSTAIVASDKAYIEGKDDPDPMKVRMAYSGAINALGIRRSNSPQAKIDKEIRGSTFVGLPGDIALYFRNLDAVDIDMDQIRKNMKTSKVIKTSPSEFSTGGGIDMINADLLEMLSEYVEKPEAVAYFTRMHKVVGGAKVFEDDPMESVAYLMQGIINSYLANFKEVTGNPDDFVDPEATENVAKEACRTMLALPTMHRLTAEEKSQLPEASQVLLTHYENMLKKLTENIIKVQ